MPRILGRHVCRLVRQWGRRRLDCHLHRLERRLLRYRHVYRHAERLQRSPPRSQPTPASPTTPWSRRLRSKSPRTSRSCGREMGFWTRSIRRWEGPCRLAQIRRSSVRPWSRRPISRSCGPLSTPCL